MPDLGQHRPRFSCVNGTRGAADRLRQWDPLGDRGADRPVEGEDAARDGGLARQSGHPVADFRANFKAAWMDKVVFVMDSCPDELSGSAAGHARTIALVACAYATGTGKKK